MLHPPRPQLLLLCHLHPDRALPHAGADKRTAEGAFIPHQAGALWSVEADGNIDKHFIHVRARSQRDGFISAFLLAAGSAEPPHFPRRHTFSARRGSGSSSASVMTDT